MPKYEFFSYAQAKQTIKSERYQHPYGKTWFPKELKLLFQFAGKNDIEKIESYKDSNHIADICSFFHRADLKAQDWHRFIDKYNKLAHPQHLLSAAYIYSDKPFRFTEKQFCTAFYFLGIAMDDPDYEILDLGEYYDELFKEAYSNVLPKKDELIKQCLSGEHNTRSECFAIGMNMGKLNKKTEELLSWEAYRRFLPVFVLRSDKIIIPSFSAIECITLRDSNHPLILSFGQMPRKNFIDAVMRKKINPYALDFRDSEEFIHGRPVAGSVIFSFTHDIFHSIIRETNPLRDDPKINILLDIIETILERRNPNLPLVKENYIEPVLAVGATQDQLVTKILLEISSTFLDAERIGELVEFKLIDKQDDESDNQKERLCLTIENCLALDIEEIINYRVLSMVLDKKPDVALFNSNQIDQAKSEVLHLLKDEKIVEKLYALYLPAEKVQQKIKVN